MFVGIVQLNRYVIDDATARIFTVQYDVRDSRDLEPHRFRAHLSPLSILAKAVL